MPVANDKENLTLILNGLAQQKTENLNLLIAQVYTELKHVARRQLQAERVHHTLNPTALAHEAYLKLIDQKKTGYADRQHFFALASGAMRRILIDYARARKAEKRGGDQVLITFIDENVSRDISSDILLALDELLQQLSVRHPRQAKIIEYWFFGGMKHREIAGLLDISEPTVRRDWRVARAWLNRELKAGV